MDGNGEKRLCCWKHRRETKRQHAFVLGDGGLTHQSLFRICCRAPGAMTASIASPVVGASLRNAALLGNPLTIVYRREICIWAIRWRQADGALIAGGCSAIGENPHPSRKIVSLFTFNRPSASMEGRSTSRRLQDIKESEWRIGCMWRSLHCGWWRGLRSTLQRVLEALNVSSDYSYFLLSSCDAPPPPPPTLPLCRSVSLEIP